MRALVLEPAADGATRGNRSARLVRDHPDPVRRSGEALVAVRLAGVCDTDLQLARGYGDYHGVLGHEMVGAVIDADDRGWIGRRVIADINHGCGSCDDCREHDGHHCAQRTVLGIAGRDGAIADRVVVAERSLVVVPDDVSDEWAVFAEPLAAAAHVLDGLGAANDAGRTSDPIVVLGDGKLGLLIVFALRAAGRTVQLVGHHRDKLALAAATGAAVVLDAELDASQRAAVVVEATGSNGGLRRALALVRPRGRVILKSTIAGGIDVDLTPVVVDELTLVGSRCGDMSQAVALLASGAVDPTPLIAARYGLDDAEEALRHAAEPGVLKVLVKP